MRSGKLGQSPLGDLQLGTPGVAAPAAAPPDQASGQLGNPLATLGRFQLGTPTPELVAPSAPAITGTGAVTAPCGYGTGRGLVSAPLPPIPVGQLPAATGGMIGRGEHRRLPKDIRAHGQVVAPLGIATGEATNAPPAASSATGTVRAPRGSGTGQGSVAQPQPRAAVARAIAIAGRGHGTATATVPYTGRGGVRSTTGATRGRAAAHGPTDGTGRVAARVGAGHGNGRVGVGTEDEALWLLGLGELTGAEELVLL